MTVDQQALLDTATGVDPSAEARFWGNMLDAYVQVKSEIPPWWSTKRDQYLRMFWKDGLYGSALMNLAQGKLAAMPMNVVPRDRSIASHVEQAAQMTMSLKANAGFGAGWFQTMQKFSEDYLGQDNGAFLEIVGNGRSDSPIEGPVMGIRHLDAARCQRTGHPMWPVLYRGDDGKMYKMHFARILFMSQMPSANEDMHDVGFCSVSRSYRLIENLLNIVNYKDERMGARPVSQLLVGTGITGKEIIKALATSEVMMDNLGMRNMARTVALGSATGEVDVKRVDLTGIEQFDEQTTFTFASYALALAWGVEFNEIIPMASGRQSEVVALQRSRGMLPAQFISSFQEQAAIKLIPPHLELQLDYPDDQADKEHAMIEDIVSRSFQRQMEAGVTTPEVVQQIMHDRGYLSDEQMNAMRLSRHLLPTGAPVAAAFFDEAYSDLLMIKPEYLVSEGVEDPSEALAAIELNELHIYSVIGVSPSSRLLDRCKIALAALEWLSGKYTFMPVDGEEEVDPEADEEAAADGDESVDEREKKELSFPATNFYIKNNRVVWENETW